MRRLALALASSALLAIAGCDSEEIAAPVGDGVEGRYTLRTVNGQPLPFTFFEMGADHAEIVSDTFDIHEGVYTSVTRIRRTTNNVVRSETVADAGEWARVGATLHFLSHVNGAMFQARSDGRNTLTFDIDGLPAVYQR